MFCAALVFYELDGANAEEPSEANRTILHQEGMT